MPLPSGSFGPYEILAPLGAGGMGEVYRARDRRLGREVALKVLPADLSADADRLARFEQEARSASALNHPNIVTIHEIGQHDETSYISMELVDGKTLRELVATGPMPIRKLLGISAQVAEGLAKAHTAGIVHRDLKPENVMVSRDGFVKILDFGLAKLVEPESGGELSAMPTLARAQTHPGVVMGTVAYMSPEQASGEPVDFRSDQFSFGSILYEALGGEKPFFKKTAAETMSAIIREDPKSIGALRPDVPLPLRWIVERCLAKDPEERYASTRDLARDLAGVRDHVSEITSGAELAVQAVSAKKSKLPMVAAAAAAVLLAVAGGWIAARARSEKATAPTFRRLTFRSGFLNNARFTPDGQTVVYGAGWAGGPRRLYAVRPESPESRSFDMDADILAISAAGEMAVLIDENPLFGTLARVPFAGGVPRPVVERVPYASADWSPDGRELAIARNVNARYHIEFPIGKVLYEGPFIRGLRFSPGGDRIAFFQLGQPGAVIVISRAGGKVKTLASGFDLPGGSPCWSPDGKEIWFTGSSKPGSPSGLHAVDLEGKVRLVAQMPGELELDDISRDGRVLLAHHTIIKSLRGLSAGDSVERELTWLDRPDPFGISSDGKTILFSEVGEGGGPSASVYARKTDGSPAVRLGEGRGLALSPDGSTVLVEFPNARDRLGLVPTGPGEPRTLPLAGFEEVSAAVWMPDGKAFLLSARERGKTWRIYRAELPEGRLRPLSAQLVGIPPVMTGALSPDGSFLLSAQGPGRHARFSLGRGEFRPIVGLEPGEFPIRWTSDGHTIYTQRQVPQGPFQIWRLDPDTGERVLSREIRPADPGATVERVVLSPDGRAYAYLAARIHAQLYVVEGLK